MQVQAPTEQRISELRERLGELSRRWQVLLSDLPTPCLVVDKQAAQTNCSIAAAEAGEKGVVIRPHAKAHKCSSILHMQLAAGSARGVTCATVYEAGMLASLGFDDVLVANEVVTRKGSELLSGAARRVASLRIAVDSELGADCAGRAAKNSGRDIGILIDLEVGSARCGLSSQDAKVVELARYIARLPGLRLEGLMAYTGKANYDPDRAHRAAVAQEIMRRVGLARSKLVQSGFQVRTISGGSTGLWDIDHGLTEVQLGSYVLMEARYATVGLPFATALFCAATVISRTRSDHAVLDCGWKAVTEEFGLPLTPPELTPLKLSDEHLICEVAPGASLDVGDVVLTLPAHLDPTMNLHDRLLAVGNEGDASEWKIDLRRAGPPLMG